MIACVGGGSNAIGMFADFIDEPPCALSASNPVVTASRAASTARRSVTAARGLLWHALLPDAGQPGPDPGVLLRLGGLDFPSVGPQHAHLAAIGRAEYPSVTDKEALDAFQELAKSEGIIPALESSHAWPCPQDGPQ